MAKIRWSIVPCTHHCQLILLKTFAASKSKANSKLGQRAYFLSTYIGDFVSHSLTNRYHLIYYAINIHPFLYLASFSLSCHWLCLPVTHHRVVLVWLSGYAVPFWFFFSLFGLNKLATLKHFEERIAQIYYQYLIQFHLSCDKPGHFRCWSKVSSWEKCDL